MFLDTEFPFEEMKTLEVDGGDGYMIVWVYLMPLNYALKNGEYGYIYITIIETDSLYPHVLMFMPLCDHCIPLYPQEHDARALR